MNATDFKTSDNVRAGDPRVGTGLRGPGRPPGMPNRLTTAFRDALRAVYEDIGGNEAFAKWARENRSDFYKICARLIPTEVNVRDAERLTVIVDRSGALR